LGEAIGISGREFSIEDMFPDDFYLEKVKQVYKKELTTAGVDKIDLKGNDRLCKRVERTLEGFGIKFNKGFVAKVIRAELSRMSNADSLPPETKAKAKKLMEAIKKALPMDGKQAVEKKG
jgi:hypothetical protein